jgi:hypothetical protein
MEMEGRLERFLDLIFDLQHFAKDHPEAYILLTRDRHFDVRRIWSKTLEKPKEDNKQWRRSVC